jgi:hypothetical protein
MLFTKCEFYTQIEYNTNGTNQLVPFVLISVSSEEII